MPPRKGFGVLPMALLGLAALTMAGVRILGPLGRAPSSARPLPPAPGPEGDIDVHFSPNGGCTEAIVREIDDAKESVLCQAYSFTSFPIAKALAAAQKRGVKVTALLDQQDALNGDHGEAVDLLVKAGVPVFLDGQHVIAHNKVIVVDGKTVITGSFNFTRAAEASNAENLLVLHGREKLGWEYTRNFKDHLNHSTPYEGSHGETLR